MPQIPDYIVHYSRGEPFGSVTSHPRERWPEIIQGLSPSNTWGSARFSDPEYLNRRWEIEKLMRREFIKKGGAPALEHPIYFFLGRHQHFEEHPSNNASLIRLEDLPPQVVSFTYGDSLIGYDDSYRKLSDESYTNPLCGEVFLISEIPRLLSQQLAPGHSPLAIEVQLWMVPPKNVVKKLEF